MKCKSRLNLLINGETLLFLFILLTFFSNNSIAQKEITLSDIYENSTFKQKSVKDVNWMKDGQYYSSLKDNNIVKFDIATGNEVEVIVKGSELNPSIQISSYNFSKDEKKLLLSTNKQPIYRRSYTAEFYVYNIKSKKLQQLSSKGKQSYATFSPDGFKVAFVRKNNLYFVELDNMTEHQITSNGKFNNIINGSTDWVYEEEFSFVKAFFWSPDNEKIAYYIFDESEVKEYNMQVWDTKDLYPIDYRYKYPKAGEANSKVKINIYHLTGRHIRIDLDNPDYIPRINWTQDPQILSVRKMNRHQNQVTLLHVDADSGDAKVILEEKNDTYIDIEYCDDLTYLNDKKHFIYSSEISGYKHLYLYSIDGKLVRQITKGDWEVTTFLGIDESSKKKKLFYVSTESSPLERDFYSIDLNGKKKVKLSKRKGTHKINMSADFKYYLDYYSSATTPLKVFLFQTKKNEEIKVLEENTVLNESIKAFKLSEKELFSFANSNKDSLNGYILKPANFDKSKKYPVLMFVYGGPGSQMVANSWGGGNIYWHHLLTQKGYMIVCVDNRGTGFKGSKFKKMTYAQLGKYEVEDQIETAKYLAKLPYVDKDRIGIWGWSYGGYLSSLCIMKGNEYFKAAIAVAPVSTWRYYDTIYTERFLKTPQENPSGYDDNSPITHVDKLKGNYLLVHGTGDDNVHFQNAIILQNALIKAGKQYQSFYYPDRNHGIYGGNTRIHLFEMLTTFIKEKL